MAQILAIMRMVGFDNILQRLFMSWPLWNAAD